MARNIGIGWDIGIKNLAYCILEPQSATPSAPNSAHIKFNNTYYSINHWRDISLVSQIESNLQSSGEVSLINTTLKCACPKTDKVNAPICGNNAIYCAETLNADGTYRGYCKNHFKKSGVARMPELNVKRCYVENCNGKPAQVLKNHIYMGYCKKHINELITSNQKQSSEFLKINRAKTTAKIDINHLGIALFQELDKIKSHVLEPNIILLENQPVLKNPTMKSMQMFLYSYYLIRHMEQQQGLGDKNLQCYTASKKLDLIKFFPQTEQTRIDSILASVKSGYQKNKKMSILMVEYLLRGNTKWLEFFNKHPKQDDLADSLLMTLHYFEKNNLAKLKKDIQKQDNTTANNALTEKPKTKAKSKVKRDNELDKNNELERLIDDALDE